MSSLKIQFAQDCRAAVDEFGPVLHRLSGVYPSATYVGSREFQASSPSLAFWAAVKSSKGGSGGRLIDVLLESTFLAARIANAHDRSTRAQLSVSRCSHRKLGRRYQPRQSSDHMAYSYLDMIGLR
jgi:hypothetical protein